MNIQTLIEMGGGVGKLAAKLGVSHSTILDWKRDQKIPGNRIVQISAVLDLPPDSVIPLAALPRKKKEVAA